MYSGILYLRSISISSDSDFGCRMSSASRSGLRLRLGGLTKCKDVLTLMKMKMKEKWFIAYCSSMLDCTWDVKTLKFKTLKQEQIQNYNTPVTCHLMPDIKKIKKYTEYRVPSTHFHSLSPFPLSLLLPPHVFPPHFPSLPLPASVPFSLPFYSRYKQQAHHKSDANDSKTSPRTGGLTLLSEVDAIDSTAVNLVVWDMVTDANILFSFQWRLLVFL